MCTHQASCRSSVILQSSMRPDSSQQFSWPCLPVADWLAQLAAHQPMGTHWSTQCLTPSCQTLLDSPAVRRRRRGGHGLGGDAGTHVPALGGGTGLQGGHHQPHAR